MRVVGVHRDDDVVGATAVERCVQPGADGGREALIHFVRHQLDGHVERRLAGDAARGVAAAVVDDDHAVGNAGRLERGLDRVQQRCERILLVVGRQCDPHGLPRRFHRDRGHDTILFARQCLRISHSAFPDWVARRMSGSMTYRPDAWSAKSAR